MKQTHADGGCGHLQLHARAAAASLLVAALEQPQAVSNVVPSLGQRKNPAAGSHTRLQPGTQSHITTNT